MKQTVCLFSIAFSLLISLSVLGQNNEIGPNLKPFNGSTNDATWDVLFSFSCNAVSQPGIETDGNFIYTSTWNVNGKFSKYTMAGVWVEDFSISGIGAIRDMAFDGTYFYGGAAASNIYILDLNSKVLVGTIATGLVQIRHISFDPNASNYSGGFWTGNWNDLNLVSATGESLINVINFPLNMVYGNAYDPYTSSGPYLWIFAQGAGSGTPQLIYQFDIQTLSITGLTHNVSDIPGYNAAEAIAGGLATSTNVVAGKFVMLANIQQTNNLIGGYELALTADTSAPGPVTNLVITPEANGVLSAGIAWTNPSVNAGGTALTQLTAVKIYRNEVLIYTVNNPPIGGNSSYNDNAVTGGMHSYKLIPENSYGTGAPEIVGKWIGPDVPATVTNLVLTAQGEDGLLTWTNPTAGLHGGYYTGLTGYTIVRMPDNASFNVAGPVTQWLDNTVPAAGTYYYTVTTKNNAGNGGSITSNSTLLNSGSMLFFEEFTSGTIPIGWSQVGAGATNWSVVTTGNAGGASPELRFNYSPSFVGLSTMMTGVINTSGINELTLEFKHFVDWYSTTFTCGIATTSDGGATWNPVWEVNPIGNVGPETINITITDANVGSANFQLGFFFNGNSIKIDKWYIDNIILSNKRFLFINNLSYKTSAIAWQKATSNSSCLFIKETANGHPIPADYTAYTANPIFGQGSQIQNTGWYCVYNGTGNSITVTSLEPLTTYRVMVCEYTGEPGFEVYNTNTGNPANFTTEWAQYTEVFTDISGTMNGNLLWADYDGDDDHDLLVTGYKTTGSQMVMYKNNNGAFEPQNQLSFPGFDNSAATWFDHNNDNEPDLLISGFASDCNCYTTRLYSNTGDGNFTAIELPVPTHYYPSLSTNDFNFDGRQDFVVSGFGNESTFTGLYRNEGNGVFSFVSDVNLPGVLGHVSFHDVDLDGSAELLISGYNMECDCGLTKIFRITNVTGFEDIGDMGLPGLMNTYASWRDVNSDGYDDLLLSGYPNEPDATPILKLYLNNGGNSFFESGIALPQVMVSGADWTDFDNNGFSDLVITGTLNDQPYTGVFKNVDGASFTNLTDLEPVQLSNSAVAFADYDKDGDVDLVLGGSDENVVKMVKVYKNLNLSANTPPTSPINLTTEVNGNQVTLNWGDGSDAETTAAALGYNLKVGTTPGGSEIKSGLVNGTSGFTKTVNPGNVWGSNTFTFPNLPPEDYYWSVQTVDQGYLTSGFASGVFTTSGAPTIQASNIVFSDIATESSTISWTNGNGEKRVVFMKKDSVGLAEPVHHITYSPSNVFGQGSQIENTGWYCIYNGTGNTVSANGLLPGITYRVMVCEYNGLGGAEVYKINLYEQNPLNLLTLWEKFTEIQSNLPGVYHSSSAWGDYDNDGDLDIAISGIDGYNLITKVLKNIGNANFIDLQLPLLGVYISSISWIDIDNDGDLDLSYTGAQNSNRYFKIFRNDGNDIFFDIQSPIGGTSQGELVWADFDNDGDLDIIITGGGNSANITKIYINHGNMNFEDSQLAFQGVYNSDIACGDYDNDGDMDFVLTGHFSENGNSYFITKLYRNDGQSGYVDLQTTLQGVSDGDISWGDFDADGDLDLGYTGIYLQNGSFNYVSRIYRNEGNNSFINTQAPIIGLYGSSLDFGDYDNDGFLDLLTNGRYISQNITKLYKNNGLSGFTDSEIPFTGSSEGSIDYGDYDSDGDLDILLTGYDASPCVTKIFRNNLKTSNQLPTAPTTFSTFQEGETIYLSFSGATDPETLEPGLTYNLCIGSTPGGQDIMAPMADLNTGYRRIPAMGNVQLNRGWKIKGLSPGTYYYKVQAIDNCFAGGPWSEEQSFTVYPVVEQNIQIPAGWSGISGYAKLSTAQSPVELVTQPIISNLSMLQNLSGVYLPSQGINTLGNWNYESGYAIKTTAAATLPIEGYIPPVRKVHLNQGWNIMPSLTPCNISVAQLLQPVINKVSVVQEVARPNIYWPAMNINSIQALNPGKAYYIRLSDTATIEFTDQFMNCDGVTAIDLGESSWSTPWGKVFGSPSSHIIGIENPESHSIKAGDWLGVFTHGEKCAGAVEFNSVEAPAALVAFGLDDSFQEGETMHLRLYRASEKRDYEIQVQYDNRLSSSDGKFTTSAISVIQNVIFTGFAEFDPLSEIKVFPNPALDQIYISGIVKGEKLKISLLNSYGSQIYSTEMDTDGYIDLSNIPKGIYFIKIQNLMGVKTEKLVVK